MYKMGQISKEAYKKCEVEIIDKRRYFWINRRDLEVEPDYENWAQLREKLGLDSYKITCDKQDIISALRLAFEGKIIHNQFCIKTKILDAYLPKYKFGKEIDEYYRKYRDPNYEQSR